MTILNYDKHRIVMFVSVCNSMDVLGQQVVCPDIVPCEWASNTSRLVNTLKSSSLCICFFFSALFSISQWYFSISKKRRQQKKKTAKEEGSKRRIQLDQVHLACRTQLLLPGLVAVVHHVHVHHVTWECHI